MHVNGGNKGGLNELLTAMLHNENKDIPYHELKSYFIELRMMQPKCIIQNMVQMTQKLDLV